MMLWIKLPVVDRIQQSNKFAMCVKNKAKGDSKLNGSPANVQHTNSLKKHTAQRFFKNK